MGKGGGVPIVHVLEATIGGTRTHLRQLLLGLPSSEFRQVLVCSLRRNPAFWEDVRLFRKRGVEVHVLPLVREIRPLWDAYGLGMLLKTLRPHRHAILHTHSAKAGFLGRLAGRWLRFSVVLYTPHAFPFLMEDSRSRQRFYLALERLAAPWATRILCVSESERRAALEAGLGPAEKLLVIPNGVPLPPLSPEARQEARRRLGVEKELVLGSVGHLSEQKGLIYLLRALRGVLRRYPQARLFLFGRGPLEGTLRRQAKALGLSEAVRFMGLREPMEDYYPAFDLFVLPSLWEGCPYSLLEAMSFGVPTVGTRVVGIVDAVQHGESGWLVPPRDAEALERAIEELLGDAPRRQRLGQGARRRIAKHFLQEHFLERMARLYRSLWRQKAPMEP